MSSEDAGQIVSGLACVCVTGVGSKSIAPVAHAPKLHELVVTLGQSEGKLVTCVPAPQGTLHLEKYE